MKNKELRLLLSRDSSRSLFVAIIFASVLSAAILIFSAILLGTIITGVIYHHPDSLQWIVALGLLWIFRAFLNSQFEYWCSRQASKIKNELRGEVTSHIDALEPMPSGELSSVLIKGVNSLDIYLGRFLPQLFSASIVTPAVLATVFILDPLSGFIAVFTLPLIPLFGALIGRYTSDSVSKKWKSLGVLSHYFEDSLDGFLTLKIFGRGKSQGDRIQIMGDKYTQETMKVLRISFLSAFVLELVATISVALIAVSIGLRLVDGKISFIHSLILLILAPEIYFPLRNAASLFHASADGSEILGRINTLQNARPAVITQTSRSFTQMKEFSWQKWELNIPGIVHSSIAPGRIEPGSSLFIVGDSGIGKSSFVENLLGLHQDSPIYVDGCEIDAEHMDSYREIVSWIPQIPHLAPGSLREQFLYLNKSISDAEIIQLLENIGLPISELPHGLDSQLGNRQEKSAELSGGQLRKIAVARALVKNPRLIIADEPTADLDSKSAGFVMSALENAVAGGAALICITHDCDVITSGASVVAVEKVSQ